MLFSVVCTLIENDMRRITVVKLCCGPQHFHHCDDAYSLSIRVQTTLSHIRFVATFICIFICMNIVVTVG